MSYDLTRMAAAHVEMSANIQAFSGNYARNSASNETRFRELENRIKELEDILLAAGPVLKTLILLKEKEDKNEVSIPP